MSKSPEPGPTTSAALEAGSEGVRSGEPRRRRKLSAIIMVDVSGFSRMMGADEEKTVRLI